MYKKFDFKIKDLFFSCTFEDDFLTNLEFDFYKGQFENDKTLKHNFLNLLKNYLLKYLDGELVFFDEVKLKIGKVSDFQAIVYKNLLKVSYGKTVSYKELAESSYSPKASRAVGGLMALNPIPILIPCHRVIKSDGSLGGYKGGLDLKRYLLDLEKINYKK